MDKQKLRAKTDLKFKPSIFTDKTYQVLNDFVISTSTLNTEFIQFGGFGPMPGCYGFGYMVFDDWLGVCVSGYKVSTIKIYLS